jgi:NAD(P)-dependent dehydrogenase (short-subunit alcohol dehydrogenase family)
VSRPTADVAAGPVLVTGAASGIGRETALAFARAGAPVLAVDIDEAGARSTAGECARTGPPADAFGVDVADRRAVADLADKVHASHGPLEVLVNNAGVGMSGRFLDVEPADWDWIVGINLMGVIHGCQAFGPAMVARGRGHVVNLASGLAYTHTASEGAYVTTKAAVLAFSRCLRADWYRHGVGVSVVCPGIVNTPIVTRARFRGASADPDQVRRLAKLFRRRNYPPSRVADAILAAVEHDRPVVPVSPEARVGWMLHRLLPVALSDRLARVGVGRD